MPHGSADSQLAPLAIAVPIIMGCFLLAAGKRIQRPAVDSVATAAALGAVGIDAALLAASLHGRVVTWSGGFQPRHGLSVGIVVVVDPLGAGIALIASSLMTIALLYSWRYFESVRAHYHALMLLFLAGMQGFALTGDLFDMFVFFELMGAVAYALTGFMVEEASALQGAVNFGIINSLGAYLSLTGIALLYARTGQLGLPQLSAALTGRKVDALVVASFLLVATGFLVKAAMTPFHFWLADAHAVAPATVCVLFSGVMVELGIYGVARVYWVVFSGPLPVPDMRRSFIVLGTVTAVVGAVMCFQQRHLKRLLAYSTISHVGLFLLGFAALDPAGTAGAAIYVAGHAGIKSALFLMAGILLNRYGTVDEGELHGRGLRTRAVGILFLLGGLALAGLPPFGTALGKAASEAALFKLGYPWAPALFVVVSAVTGGAVLRAGARVYLGLGEKLSALPRRQRSSETEEERVVERPLTRTPHTMLGAIALLMVGGLSVGLIPGIGSAVSHAASRFISRPGYVGSAFLSTPYTKMPQGSDVQWTATGVGLDVASVVLAVGLAGAALYAGRIPVVIRSALRPVGVGLRGLRQLHSGHVGDYVAWMFVGIAGLAALVGLPLR